MVRKFALVTGNTKDFPYVSSKEALYGRSKLISSRLLPTLCLVVIFIKKNTNTFFHKQKKLDHLQSLIAF